jgi:hypothetical protein
MGSTSPDAVDVELMTPGPPPALIDEIGLWRAFLRGGDSCISEPQTPASGAMSTPRVCNFCATKIESNAVLAWREYRAAEWLGSGR